MTVKCNEHPPARIPRAMRTHLARWAKAHFGGDAHHFEVQRVDNGWTTYLVRGRAHAVLGTLNVRPNNGDYDVTADRYEEERS